MSLPNILGFIGDHAYRASSLTRHAANSEDSKRTLELLVDAMHEALPMMLDVLGTAPAAPPQPKPEPPTKIPAPRPPKPPKPKQTVGHDMKALRRELAAQRSTPRTPDPTPDEIRARASQVRAGRVAG